MDFFPQSLSHLPRWDRSVYITWSRISHAWAPLTALVGLVQNIFFLTVHFFDSSVLLSTRKAGQAAVLGRLSFSVCVSGSNFVERDYLIQPATSHGYYRVNEVKSAQRKGGSCFFLSRPCPRDAKNLTHDRMEKPPSPPPTPLRLQMRVRHETVHVCVCIIE
jgi:hypothetical protein